MRVERSALLWRWIKWISTGTMFLAIVSSLVAQFSPAVRAAGDVGYRDFSYGSGISKPTGEKPESKLWWNDGFWWGSMYNDASAVQAYHIYRLNLANQTWEDTGIPIDDREDSRADALWDDASQKLYVVSHIFNATGLEDPDQSKWGKLYRYSYNNILNTYTLDLNFPVDVTRGVESTLVIAKDSTGQLWVTYVEFHNSIHTVMVNHSAGTNHASWGTPYPLPVSGATLLSSDDISSIVTLDGQVGVMWSNQPNNKMYFASHQDGAPDTEWLSTFAYAPPGAGADDHINLKSLQSDGTGKIFAVTKTSFSTPSAPIIVLLSCTLSDGCVTASNWQAYTVYRVIDGYTRPILLIDTSSRQLNVFATNSEAGGSIMRKVANIDNIAFPVGPGTPFIERADSPSINNATSTKQNVNSTTGMVVLASDDPYYLHNYLAIAAPPTATPTRTPTRTPTPTPTLTPTSTPTPTLTPTLDHYVFLPSVVN